MSALSVETPLWQSLWVKARVARETGAIGRALAFFEQTLAQDPPAPEPYAEAADFVVQIARGLAPLEKLYERHRAAFDLSPNDISFRAPELPTDGEGLSRAARWLEIAANHEPGNPIHQERRAELLEELGRLEAALACRRRVAQYFPAIKSNCWALAILLERTGATSEALSYCEGLLSGRATVEPIPTLCLARLYEQAGRHENTQLLGQRLTVAIARAGPGAAAMLFRFAWSAAIHGMPAAAVWPHALLLQAVEIARQPDASVEAHLAAGFAVLIFGDENASRQHFSAACWKAYEQLNVPALTNASRELRHALDYASRRALDLASNLRTNNGPPVATRDLLLACAHTLRNGGRVAENLARFDVTFAAMFNLAKDQPFELPGSDVYRGYRIVTRGDQYYAIPLTMTSYTIVRGTVYRVPGKARVAMEFCPPRIRRGLRSALAGWSSWKPGIGAPTESPSVTPTGGRVAHIASRLLARLFALFAMHDTLTTTDVLALYGKIDATFRTRR